MGVLTPPKKLLDQWGREYDQSSWAFDFPPQQNPDPTDNYFDISNNPHIVAGMAYSDVSSLFVSARGLTDEQNGAFFPPQLMFTTPELTSEDILDLVAWQFDEEFEGGFSEVIRSTDGPCKTYGHIPIEYEWYRRETNPHKGKMFVRMAWARDPERYRYDIEGKPGIYRAERNYATYTRMHDAAFQSYAYNPLFNNPYGSSINLPLKPWIETFNKIFGYWRHALEKAGLGSWGASYPNTWSGKDPIAVANRATLEGAIKKIAGGTWSLFPEGAKLENYKLQMEAQAFLDWYTSFAEVVSLIYTGTTTALKEAEFGSRSAKESTDVREKSQREKFNAARISNFWTWKFIPLLVNVNFPASQIKSYPTLQLIRPELQMPTTPQGQDTARETGAGNEQKEEITVQTRGKREEPPELMAELQEPEEPRIPLAIPANYESFPRDTDTPAPYAAIVDEAQAYLRNMEAKPYRDVSAEDAPKTFTIKRLRNFDGADEFLQELKNAIIPTLAEKNEADAWKTYYDAAARIFSDRGIMIDSEMRDNLVISFRQARQNAFSGALVSLAQSDTSVTGIKINTLKDGHKVRFVHELWDGVVLAPTDERLARVLPPSDFGCVCYAELDRSGYVTPDSELPDAYPGQSYRFYAQTDLPETQGDA